MVDLKSGQSFMIAGLLQSHNDTGTQRLPGLGKLPILGNLFSSKAYQRRETDLVIIITPYLVKPIDPSKRVRTPMDDTKAPQALDYFLGDREELRISQLNGGKGGAAQPARGYGHYLELN
jgi:pilus assembly protein CpaC